MKKLLVLLGTGLISMSVFADSRSGGMGALTAYKTTVIISTGALETKDTTFTAQVLASTGIATTVFAMFASTDTTGDMSVSTFTVPIYNNITITDWDITCDVAGSCQVRISTADFNTPYTDIDGGVDASNTKGPNAVSQVSSSGTTSGWTTTKVAAGSRIRFTLLSADTVRSFTISLRGIK